MKVKCINVGVINGFTNSNSVRLLKEGEVYEVYNKTRDKRHISIIIEGKPYAFFSERFIDVSDEDICSKNSISKLFEEKVRSLNNNQKKNEPLKEGDKVHYKHYDFIENGIIKSIADENHAFVVYKWGDNPEDYLNYTGVITALKHLKRGWHDNIQSERDTPESNRNK